MATPLPSIATFPQELEFIVAPPIATDEKESSPIKLYGPNAEP